jgi:mannosyl-3-phosphoglycerate phosphatase
MEVIQRELDLNHPFISETGAGLFVPHGYFRNRLAEGRFTHNYRVLDFGQSYHQVAEALHHVARRVGTDVTAFSHMSIQDVAQTCDLSLSQARLAKLREYDEPFRLSDSDPAVYSRLCSGLRRRGLRCFTHESFHHATGVADKTHSLRQVASLYRQNFEGQVLTVGLARASSESCLLHSVDPPVVVQGTPADAARLASKVPTARFTQCAGPRGWSDAIRQLLDGHQP